MLQESKSVPFVICYITVTLGKKCTLLKGYDICREKWHEKNLLTDG